MSAGGAAAPLPAVHDTGEGPAILFLHAFPLESSQWDHQVAALSGQYRCVRVDVWGCGASPPPSGPPSFSSFAAEILRALDERGIETFVACGCSMGGYVVWELLRLAPGRVTKLVLCSTRSAADDQSSRENREKLAVRVMDEGVETIVEENVARLLAKRAQDEVHISDPLRGRIRRCTPEGIAWGSRAMGARPDSSELLASIDVPSLVIAGALDAVIPSAHQRAMAERIRDARFAEVEGCGHLPNLENPPLFNEELSGFLAAA